MSNIGVVGMYSGLSNGFEAMRGTLSTPGNAMASILSFGGGTVTSMARNILFPTFHGLEGIKPTSAAGTYAVKQAADALKQSTDALTRQDGKSVFRAPTAVSTNNEAVSFTADKTARMTMEPKQITVSQLASKQENAGSAFAAKDSTISAGRYAFNIQTPGEKLNVQVSVESGDTNESLLNKIASEINAKGIGVTAKVASDEKAGTVQLILEGKNTGERNGFAVTDVSGNLAEVLGVDQVSKQAADARYTVNGKAQTSAGNTVSIGDGITAALHKTTDSPVTVSMRRVGSTDAVVSAVRSVVDSFNQLMDNSSRASNELSRMARSYSSTLSTLGITMGNDGQMKLDADLLQKALESGEGEKLLTDSNGVFARMGSRAAAISRSPTAYGPTLGYNSSGSVFGYGSQDFMGLLFNGAI